MGERAARWVAVESAAAATSSGWRHPSKPPAHPRLLPPLTMQRVDDSAHGGLAGGAAHAVDSAVDEVGTSLRACQLCSHTRAWQRRRESGAVCWLDNAGPGGCTEAGLAGCIVGAPYKLNSQPAEFTQPSAQPPGPHPRCRGCARGWAGRGSAHAGRPPVCVWEGRCVWVERAGRPFWRQGTHAELAAEQSKVLALGAGAAGGCTHQHGGGAGLQQARHVLDGKGVDAVLHHFL